MFNSKASGTNFEHKLIKYLEEKDYNVLRSAGSFHTDLWAVKEGKIFWIEVKSLGKNFYLSNHKLQLFQLYVKASKYGAIPILAIAFKRKGWKFYLLSHDFFERTSISYGNKGNFVF